MTVEGIYSGLRTAIRSLDELTKWANFVDAKLAEAGRSGRLLTPQERAGVANIRARWAAYQERIEALIAAAMPDPEETT